MFLYNCYGESKCDAPTYYFNAIKDKDTLKFKEFEYSVVEKKIEELKQNGFTIIYATDFPYYYGTYSIYVLNTKVCKFESMDINVFQQGK